MQVQSREVPLVQDSGDAATVGLADQQEDAQELQGVDQPEADVAPLDRLADVTASQDRRDRDCVDQGHRSRLSSSERVCGERLSSNGGRRTEAAILVPAEERIHRPRGRLPRVLGGLCRRVFFDQGSNPAMASHNDEVERLAPDNKKPCKA